jgi:hypothetical protein
MKRVKILSAMAIMAIAMVAALSMSSCKKSSGAKATLYDSLGGTKLVIDPTDSSTKIEAGRLGIRSVLDSTIFVIAGDSRINGHFQVLLAEVSATPANFTGFNELLRNLTNFVSIATGAKDYTYDGLSMTDAHNPATNSRMNGKATNADFDAFVDDLVVGAQKNNLPANLIGSVGALVETLRTQVVQAP